MPENFGRLLWRGSAPSWLTFMLIGIIGWMLRTQAMQMQASIHRLEDKTDHLADKVSTMEGRILNNNHL